MRAGVARRHSVYLVGAIQPRAGPSTSAYDVAPGPCALGEVILLSCEPARSDVCWEKLAAPPTFSVVRIRGPAREERARGPADVCACGDPQGGMALTATG
jgi:hypothetical protein